MELIMPEEVLIKKYGNRRLYDTEKNSYVVIDQVAELIRAGREVRVIDAKTKEDVTAFILTQILLDEAKKKNFLLPIPLLHLIIRYGNSVLEEFFDKYLQQIIRNYLDYKTTMDDQFKKWLSMGAQFTGPAKEVFDPLKPFFDLFAEKKTGEKEKKS
jgi:polyhydroxyalkanoate synthesis repressor PhaR